MPPRLRPLVWLSGGRVKWRTIHTVVEAGYADAFRAFHPDEPGYTMPAWDPHVRLDYVFVSRSLASKAAACPVQKEVGTSDHAPVVATFS